MGKKIHEMIGQTYGDLTVQSFSHKNANHLKYFVCLCVCGNTKIVRQSNLLTEKSRSCGCSKKKSKPIDSIVVEPIVVTTDEPDSAYITHLKETILRLSKFSGIYDVDTISYVDTQLGKLPVISIYTHWIRDFYAFNQFILDHPIYLFDDLQALTIGQQIIIKTSGVRATLNQNVPSQRCFNVIGDDDRLIPIFGLEDVWRLNYLDESKKDQLFTKDNPLHLDIRKPKSTPA